MTKQGFPIALALLIACTAVAQESAPATGATEKKPAAAAPAPAKAESDAAAKEDATLTFAPIGTAVTKGDNVNVRGQASFIGEVITKLKKGETVTLLEEITLKKPQKGEPANWFRIALPTNTPVWVFADFIDPETKAVKPARLNVRAGPGENYSVVARLQKGDTIKQIRKVEDWIEMEAPENAFAFLAADFVEKQSASAPTPAPTPAPAPTPEPAPAPTPAPAPAPEVVTVPESEQPKVAAPEVEAPKPVEAPAPAPTPAPQPVVTAPTPAPEAPAPEVAPRRVIKREGIVRRARNIQAPTYYQLEGLDEGNLINYLHSPEEKQLDPKTKKMKMVPKLDLTEYVGRRAVVTGEEVIDKRWKFTPVLVIETIELQQ